MSVVADPVTAAINSLREAVELVPAIQQKLVYLYLQEELLDWQKRLEYPALGFLYVSLVGKEDSSKSGLSATIVVDLLLIGGDRCQDLQTKEGPIKVTVTRLLDDIRNAIKLTKWETSGANRKWQFVLEAPFQLENEKHLVYRQRWKSDISLFRRSNLEPEKSV